MQGDKPPTFGYPTVKIYPLPVFLTAFRLRFDLFLGVCSWSHIRLTYQSHFKGSSCAFCPPTCICITRPAKCSYTRNSHFRGRFSAVSTRHTPAPHPRPSAALRGLCCASGDPVRAAARPVRRGLAILGRVAQTFNTVLNIRRMARATDDLDISRKVYKQLIAECMARHGFRHFRKCV